MTKGFSHESTAAKSVDWYTPPWIFEALEMKFDLDPCAPPGGVPWVPAAAHYSLEHDGLSLPWFGNVWLNPPYGKQTGQFLQRMREHAQGVALVFSRTDTTWFHESAIFADRLLFISKRVAFVDGLNLTAQGGLGSGSLLLGWGLEASAALHRFQAKRGGFITHGIK